MEDLAQIDFAVEAVTEHEPLKLDIFRKLDSIVKPEAFLASNTSSIPITKIAFATRRPEKVIGMHFMNPVPVMKLVEIIRGHATSDETFSITAELVAKLEKEMAVSEDYPGFIVNRILMPMINEAVFALYEGIATAEDIDKGMKLGTNQPMGPLTLADFIGLDTCLAIMNVLYEGFKDPKYRPCPLLVKMVNAGYLGKNRDVVFTHINRQRRDHGLQPIAHRKNNNVATLTINSPKTLNALNSLVLGELECALYELDLDQEVKVVVLTGAGEKAFVAGADIKEMSQMNAFEGHQFGLKGQRVMMLIEK